MDFRLLLKTWELTLQQDKQMKGVIFEKCVPFINCESDINNTEIDNAKDIDIVIPIFNLKKYSDNYS